MTVRQSDLPPIACTLTPGDFKARLTWIAEFNAAALRHHRRDDLRLELTYASEARDQVREMVRREQECCAFLTFDVREESDVVRVVITVPEIARHVVDTALEPFQSKAPTPTECACQFAPTLQRAEDREGSEPF
jgi:hypothetical protein